MVIFMSIGPAIGKDASAASAFDPARSATAAAVTVSNAFKGTASRRVGA